MRKALIPWFIGVAFFMEMLDATILQPAIPKMALTFAVLPHELEVAINAYLLAFIIFIFVSGWVSDRVGNKKVFSFGTVLFTLASLGCAASHSISTLVGFRIIQGIASACLLPSGRAILVKNFSGSDLLKAQTTAFIPALTAPMLSQLLGGILVDHLNWRWLFFINLPIGIGVLLLTRFVLQGSETVVEKKLDWLGLIFLFVTVTGTYLLSKGYFLGALYAVIPILIVVKIMYFSRKQDPIIEWSLFKLRSFRVSVISNISTFCIVALTSFVLPIYFQRSQHLSATQSGLILLPLAIGSFSMRLLARPIIGKFSPDAILKTSHLLLAAINLFIFCDLIVTHQVFFLMILFFIGMLSMLIFSTNGFHIYTEVAKAKINAASCLDTALRKLGMILGVLLATIILKVLLMQGRLPNDLYSIDNMKILFYANFFAILLGSIALFAK
jgi:EmrB/QacA subfamily drug resistance transporter